MYFRTERSLKHVPFTAIEWKKVQACYLMDDIKNLKESCDILNMWICRMGNSTPVFIIISELIHRSLVLDKREDCTLENADLALIYGSVIIRFVNYVNECCQPKHGAKNLSIAEAVQKMAIPGWIVNIRHDATHNNMPALTMLRKALMFCRHWLWKEHWQRQFSEAIFEMPKEVCDEERFKKDSAIKSKIYDAFENFNKWRRIENQKIEIESEDREQIPFKQLIDNMTHYAEEFVQTFVEICLSKQVNNKRRSSKTVSNTTVVLTGKKVEIITPDEQKYYSPIVRLLNDKCLLPSLLLELTRQVVNESLDVEIRSRLGGWADKLLEAFMQQGSPRFADRVTDESWNIILKHIILAPQFFQSARIEKVMNYMSGKMPLKKLRRIRKLIKIGSSSSGDENLDVSTYSVRTLADLQNNLDSENDSIFIKDSLTGEEDWSISAHEELGVLGLTSKQTAESLCLFLEPSEIESSTIVA